MDERYPPDVQRVLDIGAIWHRVVRFSGVSSGCINFIAPVYEHVVHDPAGLYLAE